MKWTTLCALALGAFSINAQAQAVAADVKCRPANEPLVYDCTIALTDAKTRAPVPDAQFTVTAEMPSMPMAHHVKTVNAAPAGPAGTYQARLALEMAGTWTVKMRLSKPMKDLLNKTVDFSEAQAKPPPAGAAAGKRP